MINSEKIKEEYKIILEKLSDPELIFNSKELQSLLEKKKYLEKILEKQKELEEIKKEIEENKDIILANEDHELVILAREEINSLKEREKEIEKELEELIKKKPTIKNDAVIIEIRAGAGGQEAALFVADLFKMYSKYAESQNWKQKVLNSHPSDLGGFKEIIFELKNGDVFTKMQNEAGVHRVQRIPITEKSGRIHTSTASVAILPKPQKAEIKINPNELKVETYKASGPGGQYVNKRMTAVRILHLPTGIVVTSQTERNLQQNKENALSILEAKLLEKKEMAEIEKLSEKRRAQIGWAKRAEKIRTYNFPQNRVTDHRIQKSWHNLDEIMEGKLEPIIESLIKNFA